MFDFCRRPESELVRELNHRVNAIRLLVLLNIEIDRTFSQ